MIIIFVVNVNYYFIGDRVRTQYIAIPVAFLKYVNIIKSSHSIVLVCVSRFLPQRFDVFIVNVFYCRQVFIMLISFIYKNNMRIVGISFVSQFSMTVTYIKQQYRKTICYSYTSTARRYWDKAILE